MDTQEETLWNKIAAFRFEDEACSFKFSQRLARENGWSIGFAEQAIEEYKKFIFLCCVTKTGVTPSDQVDQVWHLHLTYTRSYWNDLCRDTLEKEIHHNPTKGGQKEREKFNDFYEATLALYESKFKTKPPAAIWPDNQKRFTDIDFQRVNLKKYWLFPRPHINKRSFATACIVFSALISIQASGDAVTLAGIVLLAAFVLWSIFKDRGNGTNSGCSTTGCGIDSPGHGHSGGDGHSGCSGDSGCSASGCSGCGGGCGGGD